jgi:DNA-binding transcriptional LysR family regulator
LGVTLSPLKFSGLDFKDFKKGYLSVLMPQNHPLAERESVTLADLHREKWIEIDKTTHPIFNDIEKMCQDAGFTRTIVQEVSSLDLLGSLVSLGLGIAFVPTFFDADRVGGVVLKKITNLDGAPLQTVALNQVLAFKKEKLDNAILALI